MISYLILCNIKVFFKSLKTKFRLEKQTTSANLFSFKLAFHRGYMKKCYHSDCDQWNQSIATDEKYKFMTATAQSLVFSIAEMTMEDHANRHLFLATFRLMYSLMFTRQKYNLDM